MRLAKQDWDLSLMEGVIVFSIILFFECDFWEGFICLQMYLNIFTVKNCDCFITGESVSYGNVLLFAI